MFFVLIYLDGGLIVCEDVPSQSEGQRYAYDIGSHGLYTQKVKQAVGERDSALRGVYYPPHRVMRVEVREKIGH